MNMDLEQERGKSQEGHHLAKLCGLAWSRSRDHRPRAENTHMSVPPCPGCGWTSSMNFHFLSARMPAFPSGGTIPKSSWALD